MGTDHTDTVGKAKERRWRGSSSLSSGGPGRGKGTQCERIVKDHGFLHLSAGDLLRDEVQKGSEIGRKCDQLMKDGKLVPVAVTLGLLEKAMSDSKNSKGFLIDGFPRAVDQAKAFEKEVGRPKLVIYLECPKDEMEKRLLKRSETSGRSDDNAATILKRFATFQSESVPVISFYENLDPAIVLKVSAVPAPDEIYKDINCTIQRIKSECDHDQECEHK